MGRLNSTSCSCRYFSWALIFALKFVGVDLYILKRLFVAVPADEIKSVSKTDSELLQVFLNVGFFIVINAK